MQLLMAFACLEGLARTIGIEEDADRIGRELPRGMLISTLSSPAILFANHAAPCRRRSAGCCFIHSASCGAPIRQDCIETTAKSEVVTVCPWQFAGEERLHSTAMSFGAADLMTKRRLVLLLADWLSRREDDVICRAGPSN